MKTIGEYILLQIYYIFYFIGELLIPLYSAPKPSCCISPLNLSKFMQPVPYLDLTWPLSLIAGAGAGETWPQEEVGGSWERIWHQGSGTHPRPPGGQVSLSPVFAGLVIVTVQYRFRMHMIICKSSRSVVLSKFNLALSGIHKVNAPSNEGQHTHTRTQSYVQLQQEYVWCSMHQHLEALMEHNWFIYLGLCLLFAY